MQDLHKERGATGHLAPASRRFVAFPGPCKQIWSRVVGLMLELTEVQSNQGRQGTKARQSARDGNHVSISLCG